MGNQPYILWFDEIGLMIFLGRRKERISRRNAEGVDRQGVNVPMDLPLPWMRTTPSWIRGCPEWDDVMGKGACETISGRFSPASMSRTWRTSPREAAGCGGSSIASNFKGGRGGNCQAYRRLCKEYGRIRRGRPEQCDCGGLPNASFAGQQETFLNIRGEYALSRPANDALPPFSPIGPFPTGLTEILTICRWPSRSGSRRWCARTGPAQESCLRWIRNPAFPRRLYHRLLRLAKISFRGHQSR